MKYRHDSCRSAFDNRYWSRGECGEATIGQLWISLTDILVGKFVREPYALRLMLHRFAIYDGYLELVNNRFVDRITLP